MKDLVSVRDLAKELDRDPGSLRKALMKSRIILHKIRDAATGQTINVVSRESRFCTRLMEKGLVERDGDGLWTATSTP
jgi:hypothetical protein